MNRNLLWLNKGWIRLTGAKYVALRSLRLYDGTFCEVAIFNNFNPIVLGQVTIFNTIILNEMVFDDPDLLDYILCHEYTHKKQWFRYLIYPIAIIFIPMFTLFPVLILLSLIDFIKTFNPIHLLIILLSVLIWLIPFEFSWVVEFLADYNAVKILGPEKVMETKRRNRERWSDIINKKPKIDRFFEIVFIWLTHPPLTLTCKIYRHRHHASLSN